MKNLKQSIFLASYFIIILRSTESESFVLLYWLAINQIEISNGANLSRVSWNRIRGPEL